jgi:urease accessory protein
MTAADKVVPALDPTRLVSDRETLETPALLRLLQLTSPALPIGAFAYSQGLEAAVELGFVKDESSAASFALGVLGGGLGRLDLPILQRLHGAFTAGDEARTLELTELLLASRETYERRLEDVQIGRALARLLADQGVSDAAGWARSDIVSHATLFALGAVRFEVPLGPTLHGFAFGWAENQVGALSRLIPLGQLAAQRVLAELGRAVPSVVRAARSMPDAALGSTLPALAIASALHETQYTRLFLS